MYDISETLLSINYQYMYVCEYTVSEVLSTLSQEY
jgi:hypothetical protein